MPSGKIKKAFLKKYLLFIFLSTNLNCCFSAYADSNAKPANPKQITPVLSQTTPSTTQTTDSTQATIEAQTQSIPDFETIRRLAHSGHRPEAKKLALLRLQKKNSDWDTHVILGYLYLWDGETENAKKEFSLVLANNPTYSDAVEGLSRVYFKENNPQAALNVAQKASSLAPDNSRLLYQLASVQVAANQPNNAKQTLQSLLKKDPNNQEAKALLNKLSAPSANTSPISAQKTTEKNTPQTQSTLEKKPNIQKATKKSLSKKNADNNLPDYETIKKLYQDGQIDQAQKLALIRLNAKPRDVDTRLILGYTYYRQGNYIQARDQFQKVLAQTPNYTDAKDGLVYVYLRTDQYQDALDIVNAKIEKNPKDQDAYYQKANVLMGMREYSQAADLLKSMVNNNPQNQNAKDLLGDIEYYAPDAVWKNRFIVFEAGDHVWGNIEDNWDYTTVAYGRDTPIGMVYANLNYQNRFGINSTQYEIEAYPNITKDLYAYVEYGYSNDVLYPHNRFGLEPFLALPNGYETSLGMRYLQFDSITRIYTGSISKYIGNYWVSLRPYITPGRTGTGQSYYLTLRRYFQNQYTYVGIRVGGGSSPDDSVIDPLSVNALRRESAYLEASFPITKRLYMQCGGGYNKEFYPFDRERNILSGYGQFQLFF